MRKVSREEWDALSDGERAQVYGPWDYCLVCGKDCKPDADGACERCGGRGCTDGGG